MNLAVDIGNSRIKAAAFDRKVINSIVTFSKGDESQFVNWLASQPAFEYSIVSSVVEDIQSTLALIKPMKANFMMHHVLPIPIINQYETPDTLGLDRLANAVAAVAMYSSHPVLVIDAGTCLKIDFISQEGEYKGGSISPGLLMRLQSLHTFTSKLPLIEAKLPASLTGASTQESILNGVVNGMLFEMEGFITTHKALNAELKVLLTGGDTLFFEKRLKSSIFVAPNLALQGLNEILLFNAE